MHASWITRFLDQAFRCAASAHLMLIPVIVIALRALLVAYDNEDFR